MNLNSPKLTTPFRRGIRRDANSAGAVGAVAGSADAREPAGAGEDALRTGGDAPEPGWRSSSYDLKHGLDVVELPTSLPVDVLDRLFNGPGK